MSTTTEKPAELEASIEIAAPPAEVWAVVADLPRMAEFSHQVVRTFVPGGVRLGAKMINLNRQGWKRWPTTARIVRCDPEREIAFRVYENRTIWSYRLVPTLVDGEPGTTLVHRRETPDGISGVSLNLTKIVLGGVPGFTEELRDGMHRTLAKIKTAVEQ